jgi:hypothetical protein
LWIYSCHLPHPLNITGAFYNERFYLPKIRDTACDTNNIINQQSRADINAIIHQLATVAEEMDLSADIQILKSFANYGKDSFTALTTFRFAEYIYTHGEILSFNGDCFSQLYGY